MTTTPAPESRFAALEATRRNLRRQIGIVVALIVALSIALAATSFFPHDPSKTTPRDAQVAPTRSTTALPGDSGAGAASLADAPRAPTTAAPPAASAVAPDAPAIAPTGETTGALARPSGTVADAETDARRTLGVATDDAVAVRRAHFVQLGIFMQPSNAEALRARLQAHGIPTVFETRVRVGPFATRDEAQAAQARLRALGFDAGAVVPPKP